MRGGRCVAAVNMPEGWSNHHREKRCGYACVWGFAGVVRASVRVVTQPTLWRLHLLRCRCEGAPTISGVIGCLRPLCSGGYAYFAVN